MKINKAFFMFLGILLVFAVETSSQSKYQFHLDLKYETPLSIGASIYFGNEINSFGMDLYKGIDDVSFIFPYISISTHNLFIYQNARIDLFYRQNRKKINISYGVSYLKGNQEMFDTDVFSIYMGIEYKVWNRLYFSHSFYPGIFMDKGESNDCGFSFFISPLCLNFKIVK